MRDTDFTRFAAALGDPALPCPPGLRAPDQDFLEERFAVHRCNVQYGLASVLADHCPVTRALVGPEFFDGMAAAYVREHLPRHAELHRYGEHFAQFIAAFPPADPLPFLADMVRLETAWQQAWSAADRVALSLRDLRGLAPVQLAASCLTVHPAATLLASGFPVGTLWMRHQQAAPDLSDLVWQPETLLVTRPALEVRVTRLDEQTAAFAAMLFAGEPITLAAGCWSGDAQSCAAGALATLLEAGAFEEIQ